MRTDSEATRSIATVRADECHRLGIEKQLVHILESGAFKNSQRSSKLLRYIVERTLDGHTELLKERLLGAEVFGRVPDYDTSADHIVRSTAGEIRRRLAQYYLQPACDDDLRIELLPGSYIPQFRAQETHAPTAAQAIQPECMEPLVVMAAAAQQRRFRTVWGIGAGLAVLCAGWWVAYLLVAPDAPSQFWRPLLESPDPIAICVGDPRTAWSGSEASAFASFPVAGKVPQRTPNNVSIAKVWFNQTVPFGDAVTVTRLGTLFSKQKNAYRVVYSPDSTLSDLRQNSAVLVGGIDNFWTMHLTWDLRYRFQLDPQSRSIFIEDQKAPGGRSWEVAIDEPRSGVSVDYAIVARLNHPATGRPIVIAGGIRDCGTLAAGEFLTSTAKLTELLRRAPTKWTNVEAVIRTKVFRGASGPPELAAAYFW